MTSLPYVAFVKDLPVDEGRKGMSAVGRCRVDLTALSTPPLQEAYAAIVAKNRQQAMVGMETTESIPDQEEREKQYKKDKKKFMKEGNAMAAKFLQADLQLDVSIVDVEVLVQGSELIETDGCLAACFLDAGCARVVTEGTNLAALEAAKIPKERLMAHFALTESETSLNDVVAPIAPHCHAISLELTQAKDMGKMNALAQQIDPNVMENVVFQFHPSLAMTYLETQQQSNADSTTTAVEPEKQLSKLIADTCRMGQNKKGGRRPDAAWVTVALTDPTAQQLGESYAACIQTDREDGLFTTVVCARNNEALGLVYSSASSVVASLIHGQAVYYSRSRNGLWHKGATSGHFQTLHRFDVDCDGDALRSTVTQEGQPKAAFCHLHTFTCWGEPRGLRHLEETLEQRLHSAPEGSYTKRLFDEPDLLRDKLVEEAQELAEARDKQDVAGELADVLYFAMTRAVKAGVRLDDAIAELDKRDRKVTRRKGDSKAFRIAAGQAILEKAGKDKPDE